jgi:uncharacterized protein YoxC
MRVSMRLVHVIAEMTHLALLLIVVRLAIEKFPQELLILNALRQNTYALTSKVIVKIALTEPLLHRVKNLMEHVTGIYGVFHNIHWLIFYLVFWARFRKLGRSM